MVSQLPSAISCSVLEHPSQNRPLSRAQSFRSLGRAWRSATTVRSPAPPRPTDTPPQISENIISEDDRVWMQHVVAALGWQAHSTESVSTTSMLTRLRSDTPTGGTASPIRPRWGSTRSMLSQTQRRLERQPRRTMFSVDLSASVSDSAFCIEAVDQRSDSAQLAGDLLSIRTHSPAEFSQWWHKHVVKSTGQRSQRRLFQIAAIVDRLASEWLPELTQSLLDGYRMFVSPQCLLFLLMARFFYSLEEATSDIVEEDMEIMEQTMADMKSTDAAMVRMRLFALLRQWIKHCFYIDFFVNAKDHDSGLHDEVVVFVDTLTADERMWTRLGDWRICVQLRRTLTRIYTCHDAVRCREAVEQARAHRVKPKSSLERMWPYWLPPLLTKSLPSLPSKSLPELPGGWAVDRPLPPCPADLEPLARSLPRLLPLRDQWIDCVQVCTLQLHRTRSLPRHDGLSSKTAIDSRHSALKERLMRSKSLRFPIKHQKSEESRPSTAPAGDQTLNRTVTRLLGSFTMLKRRVSSNATLISRRSLSDKLGRASESSTTPRWCCIHPSRSSTDDSISDDFFLPSAVDSTAQMESVSLLLATESRELLTALSAMELSLLRRLSWADVLTNGSTLNRIVSRFNAVTRWFVAELLQTAQVPEQGARLIEKLCRLALKCYNVGNFCTLLQILLALQSPSVIQLDEVWPKVSLYEYRLLQWMDHLSDPVGQWRSLRLAQQQVLDRCLESLLDARQAAFLHDCDTTHQHATWLPVPFLGPTMAAVTMIRENASLQASSTPALSQKSLEHALQAQSHVVERIRSHIQVASHFAIPKTNTSHALEAAIATA